MKKSKKSWQIIVILVILVLALILGLLFSFGKFGSFTGKVVSDVSFTSITDLGKWIDARSQGSYYANWNSLIRDESNKMHLTYCSSGEPFNPNYAPDWRNTTLYATDKVRYQYSNNNGNTWSNSQQLISASNQSNFWQYRDAWKIQRNWVDGGFWEYDEYWKAWGWYQKNTSNNIGTGWKVIIREQENLFQGGCTNSMIYYKGKYYLYFETYSPPSGILAIHVVRSDSPQGPYYIWTYDGWKLNPTNSTYKPVLNPSIRSISGSEDWIKNHYNNGVFSSEYWGAGQPRVTQKDGKIYLYFTDTTYWILWADSVGIHEYGKLPNQAIPYHLVSISEDPTNFLNSYDNRMINLSGSEVWGDITPKYFPETNRFYNFYLKNINGQNKLAYRDSNNGIVWSEEKSIANFLSGEVIDSSNPNYHDSIIETNPSLVPLSDKNGQGNFSDLYLTYSKEYLLPNAPVGWSDTPNSKWYSGGMDIYGLKVNVNLVQQTQTCTSFNYSTWSACNSSGIKSRTIISSSPSGCTGGTPEALTQTCLPPCAISNWQSSDSACTASNMFTRTWIKIGSCNSSITGSVTKSASETIACNYSSPVCTSFTYSDWGECLSSSVKTRTIVSSNPASCAGGTPESLSLACNYVVNATNIITDNTDNTDLTDDNSLNSGNTGNNNQGNNQNKNISSESPKDKITTLNETPKNILKNYKEEPGFFVKVICRISNLFSSQGYEACKIKYA